MRKLMLSKRYMYTNKRGDGSPSLSDVTQAFPTGTCDMPVPCLDTGTVGHKAEILALTLPPHFLKVLQGPLVTNLF